MSEYRKIIYPKCPYCGNQPRHERPSDYNYGLLVGMVTGRGSDDVILKCEYCGERYRVTCNIRFYTRKVRGGKDE